MPPPSAPITLTVEQIAELSQKLGDLRHDVNNNLSLIAAATELIRRRPESTERMLATMTEQPHKVAEAVNHFSRELEALLQITKP